MRRARYLVLPAAVLVLGGLIPDTSPSYAQGMSSGESGERRETRRTPAMRERVYSRLSEAQACAELDDTECAMELLAEVRDMDNLNSYETAQMWNF